MNISSFRGHGISSENSVQMIKSDVQIFSETKEINRCFVILVYHYNKMVSKGIR